MLKKYVILLVLSSLVTIGCAPKTGPLVSIPARSADTEKLALGGAQLLKLGASGERVIELLGSPNVVTNNEEGLETWVYDKVSKEIEIVRTDDGGWFFSPSRQQSTVQVEGERTLIVVIKFDNNGKVTNVRYRQTSY